VNQPSTLLSPSAPSPKLKAAIGTVAEREMTTVAEFLCRELQTIVKARLARSDDAGPAPSRPDRRHRIAA